MPTSYVTPATSSTTGDVAPVPATVDVASVASSAKLEAHATRSSATLTAEQKVAEEVGAVAPEGIAFDSSTEADGAGFCTATSQGATLGAVAESSALPVVAAPSHGTRVRVQKPGSANDGREGIFLEIEDNQWAIRFDSDEERLYLPEFVRVLPSEAQAATAPAIASTVATATSPGACVIVDETASMASTAVSCGPCGGKGCIFCR